MRNSKRCPNHAVVLGKTAIHASGGTLNILCCKACADGKDGRAIYLHYVDGGFVCPLCHAQPQTKEGIVSRAAAWSNTNAEGTGDVQLVNRWRAYQAGTMAGTMVRIPANIKALQQRADAREATASGS